MPGPTPTPIIYYKTVTQSRVLLCVLFISLSYYYSSFLHVSVWKTSCTSSSLARRLRFFCPARMQTAQHAMHKKHRTAPAPTNHATGTCCAASR